MAESEKGKYWNPIVETMPRKEIEELQTKKLIHAVNYAYGNAIHYKKSFKEAGVTPEDVKTIDDFNKLPILYKDEIRERLQQTGDPFGGLLAIDFGEKILNIAASTGTTGVPTVYAYSWHDRKISSEQDSRLKWMKGYRPGDTFFMVGPRWHAYASQLFYAMDAMGLTVLIDCGYPLPFISKKHVMTMKNLKPNVYASPNISLYSIIEAAKSMNEDPKDVFSCCKLIDAGYGDVLTTAVRKRIEKETGMVSEKIFDSGGIAEPLWYYGDCEFHVGNHCLDDLFYTNVCDLETHEPVAKGEKGECVITNLFAESLSIIRWGTEDMAIQNLEKCNCGRTHSRWTLLGRDAFAANIRGTKTFPTEIENALGDIPGFTEYFTILKYKKGPMEILKMKLAVDATKIKDQEKFIKEVKSALKEKMGVESEIEVVKSIADLPFVGHKVIKVQDLTKEAE
jgi:phenylacetate-CoA ligase